MSDINESPHPGIHLRPDDVLEVVVESDAPFLSTGQILDNVGASKPTVLDRLYTLEEQGRLASHTIAGNTPVWYLPDEFGRTAQPDDVDDEGDADEGDADEGDAEDDDQPAEDSSSSSDEEPPGGDGGGGGGVFQRIFGSVAGVAIVASVVLWTTAAPAAWPVPGLAVGAIVASVAGADRQLDDLVRSLRQGASARAAEHGGGVTGAVRAGWAAAKDDHPAPADPVTIVERLAWVDLYGSAYLFLAIPLTLPAYFLSAEGLIGLLGPTATLAYVGGLVLVAYAWVGAVIVGSLAQLALATSQPAADQHIDDDELVGAE